MDRRRGVAAARAISLTPANEFLSDEALVEEVLAGNGGEFETLVRRHQSAVYAFLLRMVRDAEEAADIAQEVFLKVFSNLEQFNPQYRFKTWLFRIAANAAVDRRRRARKDRGLARVENDDENGGIQLASRGPSPHEMLSERETRERLEVALSGLPQAYRRVILLRYQNDLRYDEIAHVTRLPLGTVKNRIFRAREMLKRALQ
jgi:RNA polymerase sigma-70 factor, ECF subfamily